MVGRMSKFPLASAEIERVNWEGLRELNGSAAGVPDALRGLLCAQNNAEAEQFYWKIENHVVVQGRLYEAAEHVIPVLLAALLDGADRETTISVMEIIFQIVAGSTAEEEIERGNSQVVELCHLRAREGLWVIYRELAGGNRDAALEILEHIELDVERLDAYRRRFCS